MATQKTSKGKGLYLHAISIRWRRRVSLTQYLESQKDQDMTRLLHFTRTQEKRRDGGFMSFGMKEMGVLYSSDGENMNGRPFNEG